MTTGLHRGNVLVLKVQVLEKRATELLLRHILLAEELEPSCQVVNLSSQTYTRFSEMLYAFALAVSLTY